LPTYSETLADTVATHEVDALTIAPSISDVTNYHEVDVVGQTTIFNDDLMLHAALPLAARALGLTGGVGVHLAAPTYAYLPGALASDRVRIAAAVLEQLTWHVGVFETPKLHATAVAIAGQFLVDGVGLHAAVAQARAVTILQELGLHPALSEQMTYSLALVDYVKTRTLAQFFFGGALADGIGAHGALSAMYLAQPSLSEDVGLHASVVIPNLTIMVSAAEDIQLEDIDALKLIYSPELCDRVTLHACYISPSGGITTWAINTRTAGVTEYTNYAFNSFAQFGLTYIGANETGIYELIGANDSGTNIIAALQGGLMQLGGSKFTSFKAAYVGARGPGQFILKLETGYGETYCYNVNTDDMRTTKIHLGKGLRARYFAYTLTSTGQDFDLDSIEFVPLVAQRRV
jgi:hypothetical protein